jgi:hypothetical protein
VRLRETGGVGKLTSGDRRRRGAGIRPVMVNFLWWSVVLTDTKIGAWRRRARDRDGSGVQRGALGCFL